MSAEVDLLEHVRGLAAAVARGGTVYEMASRARMAGDAARDLAAVAALTDPYRDGGSPLVDTMRVALSHGQDRDAADRLAQHRLHLHARAIENQTSADNPALLHPWPVPPAGGLPSTPLLDLATPAAALGKTAMLPSAWTDPPAGTLDAAEKTSVAGGPVTLDGDEIATHTASFATDVSRQVADFEPLAQAELTALFASIVNSTLEGALLADLTTAAAPVPAGADLAGTLDAAEGSSAWPAPVDVWITAIADTGTIRRSYAGQAGGPQVVPSAAQPAGTVIGFPRAAVALFATTLGWMTSDRPSAFGVDIGAYRAGFAAPRKPGAVLAVTLP